MEDHESKPKYCSSSYTIAIEIQVTRSLNLLIGGKNQIGVKLHTMSYNRIY
jgi:hypothetical protein